MAGCSPPPVSRRQSFAQQYVSDAVLEKENNFVLMNDLILRGKIHIREHLDA